MVVEQLGQAAARVPDEGGRVGHHPLHGEVPQDLIAVELHIPRREQVPVGEEHPVALPGTGRPGPAGQGSAALDEPPGDFVEGAAIGQCPAKGGGGAEQGGHAP